MPRGRPKETRALRNIRWVQKYCRIPEGPRVGQEIKLPKFMREDFELIYNNPAGTRRAILTRGRKNAKTTEAAFLVLLHLCGEELLPNSQIYSAAQSRDQAAVLFHLAMKIVLMSPILRNVIRIRETKKELVCPLKGTSYRALSAEASTAYGLSPALTIFDELGQCRGSRSELFEALETATAAQAEPLSVIISTQAPSETDLLSILIDDAIAGNDPRTVIRMHQAPLEMDPFSDEAIEAANPAFHEFMNRDEVRSMARDAKRMPARENEYRNLVLNQRVEVSAPFVSRETWVSCGTPPGTLEGCKEIFGGLDLSSTSDLTALVLVGKIDGVWQVHPYFWLPEDGLLERSRLDRVPYDVWQGQGYLRTSPGKSVDYEWVADQLAGLFKAYHKATIKIAFDRWNFKHLAPYLTRAGFTQAEVEGNFIEFGQGFVSMSPALRELEAHLLNGRIAHGMHPVLAMCARNSTVAMDPAGNRKLVKKKNIGRIDGMIALTMAVGAIPAPAAEPEAQYQIAVF